MTVAIGFALLGGVSLLYWGAPNQDVLNSQSVSIAEKKELRPPGESTRALVERYCRAVQIADCEAVIAMTWWMQEYVARQQQSKPPKDEGAVRRELCRGLQRDDADGSILQIVGMDDPYLFLPSARFEVLGADGGLKGLAKPVRERVWVHVTYPDTGAAPRDSTGRAVRSLLVAVSVSTDGYILKAGVRGNAEIDFDSVEY